MKTIANLTATNGASPEDFGFYEDAEVKRVWELYQEGTLEEIYLRADAVGAVIVLQAADGAQAEQAIASLPMVEAGLLEPSFLKLSPWPEMTRMLREDGQPTPKWWPS